MKKTLWDYVYLVVWAVPLLAVIFFGDYLLAPQIKMFVEESAFPIAEGSGIRVLISLFNLLLAIFGFVHDSFWIISPISIGLLVALELRSDFWKKHRRKIFSAVCYFLTLQAVSLLLLISIISIMLGPFTRN